MTSASSQQSLDIVGEDILQDIFTRLPATSFAYAACVSRSWNIISNRVLCGPKLMCAFSSELSLKDAVEDVMNKVLAEPIRPHLVIASVGPSYEVAQAHQHITAKLGPGVPVIINKPCGVIGMEAVSDEFKEILWNDTRLHLYESLNREIILIVGFLPGIKVEAIPLLNRTEETDYLMVDEFLTDIREFSTSVSGCESPAAIIMFSEFQAGLKAVIEKMDYAMSSDTVIVGGVVPHLLHSNGCTKAVALVFAVDRNKSPGIGEIQFLTMLSSGLSPVGPIYKAASVRETKLGSMTYLNGRIDGENEIIDGETILDQVRIELRQLGGKIQIRNFYIGVMKRRKCEMGKEKVGRTTSLAFHKFLRCDIGYLVVGDTGIRTGDIFCFYHLDPTTARSSIADIFKQFSFLKQASNSNGDQKEVFGGLIFSCDKRSELFAGNSDADIAPFFCEFPGVTFALTFCDGEIKRGDLSSHVKECPEEKSVRCCMHVGSAAYLVMTYTPPKGN